MPGFREHGRGRAVAVQAAPGWRWRRTGAWLACVLVSGCASPLATPVSFYHNLEGGEIAMRRPPPPGAGEPYPHLGTVPAKPALPDAAYRQSLQAQLTAERNSTERLAADAPIAVTIPPPPVAAPAPTGSAGPAANATLPAADAKPTAPAVVAAPPASSATPADLAALRIVGAPMSMTGLPSIPAGPPPPASFEGVSPEPLPTPVVMPISTLPPPAGTQLFFPSDSFVLPPSQMPTLRDLAVRRGKGTLLIIGLGEANSDVPDGQARAIALGLRRAEAVKAALAALHVPQGAMRVGADAFGRGAVVRLIE